MNENAPEQELNSIHNKYQERPDPTKKGYRLIKLQQELQKIPDDFQLYNNFPGEDYILTQEIQKIQVKFQPSNINFTKYIQENSKLHKEFKPEATLHLNILGELDVHAGVRTHHYNKIECSKLCEMATQLAELPAAALTGECEKICSEL